jgi:uncharacterized LabA/DUF88 family protein
MRGVHLFLEVEMDVAILLDGDFTRRVLRRKLGHWPSVRDVELFCKSIPRGNETIIGQVLYYDCPPFGGKRTLPVSQAVFDFSRTRVYAQAIRFQEELKSSSFFRYRGGHLSFDGWTLKGAAIAGLLAAPRPMKDSDFEPILSQKQVDMKIGLDVAKLSIRKGAGRILLATSDADFIPAIDFARGLGLEAVLLTDVAAIRRTKGVLVRSFTSHRLI